MLMSRIRSSEIFNIPSLRENLYGLDVEVDYRGYEVNVENFIRVLTGRLSEGTPRNKRLLSDHQSNILIYMSGHGGDGFLKFQDHTELTSTDVAEAIETMSQNKRYNEILFIVDSCQSASMYSEITSPNVVSTASALVGEDSLSYQRDEDIGVYVVDRYAYFAHRFIEDHLIGSDPLQANVSLTQFLNSCPKRDCISTVGISTENYRRPTDRVRAADFFGSRKYQKELKQKYETSEEWEKIPTNLDESKAKWANILKDTGFESLF
uniref:GPI-anchor transamidase n=1 Tax=Panagrolaimus sp. ES5 TaxID=591445 RepID=A0AC34GTC4_9BILA